MTRTEVKQSDAPGGALLALLQEAPDAGARRVACRMVVAPEPTMRVHAFAFATLAAVTTAAMAAASAQVPSQPAPSPPPQMTIAGCLKASPNPSGVPDTTTYTLEPIEDVVPPAPKSKSKSAAETPLPKTPTRYTLTSSAAIPFKEHVGHKVELRGHLKDLRSGKPDAKATGDPASKPPARGGAHHTFEVTALKMVAAACP
jgi:hypothetical protein